MDLKDIKWFPKNFVAAYLDFAGEGEAAVRTMLEKPIVGKQISANRLKLLAPAKRME